MKIEGYFSSIKRANEVVEMLKSNGYSNAISDLNDHYVMSNSGPTDISGTHNTSSMSDLVLNSRNPFDDERQGPLAAASPMASGMGGFEEIADINYKVVVNVDKKDEEEVRKIISSMGGETDNPNFQLPRNIDEVSFERILDNLNENRD